MHRKQFQSLALVGFSLQEREFGPRPHSGTSVSGSFHMESTCGL